MVEVIEVEVLVGRGLVVVVAEEDEDGRVATAVDVAFVVEEGDPPARSARSFANATNQSVTNAVADVPVAVAGTEP